MLNWVSPILVAEIISEDTANKDLERNRLLYLEVPTIREYWIVDPRAGTRNLTLLVHRRRGRRWQRVRAIPHGESYATPLLPGFSLLVDPYA